MMGKQMKVNHTGSHSDFSKSFSLITEKLTSYCKVVGKEISLKIIIRERPLMTSDDFWRFLTYLPTLFNPKTSDFLGHFEPPYLP